MFETFLKYKTHVKTLFDNLITKKRVGNLYLFVGDKGSLKEEGSLYFASKILNNCGCGECEKCTKIIKNPNLYFVKPVDDFIEKKQVTQFLDAFRIKSESPRVFIIGDFEKMTDNSANLLLKYFEQIQENVYGIILTSDEQKIIPTIKSRAQSIIFNPLSENTFASLIDPNNTNPKKTQIITLLTSDRDEAKTLLNNKMIDYLIDLNKKMHEALDKQTKDPIVLFFEEGKKLIESKDKQLYKYLSLLLVAFQNEKIKKMISKKTKIFTEDFLDFTSNLSLDVEIKILELFISLEEKQKSNTNSLLCFLEHLTKIRDLIIKNV